ncbi:Rieske 2Fe-2S domain-containing protein [Calidifontibacter indicus]|uniref:Rieske 2Fe-2S domain-containing protein n=1 Tax=Calidifontibacter indicus TaxID=419650 RepID=UPI003D756FEB
MLQSLDALPRKPIRAPFGRSGVTHPPTLTCPFHGWTFRNDGTLLKVKDPDDAGYPEGFNTEGSHDLTRSRASTPTAASGWAAVPFLGKVRG